MRAFLGFIGGDVSSIIRFCRHRKLHRIQPFFGGCPRIRAVLVHEGAGNRTVAAAWNAQNGWLIVADVPATTPQARINASNRLYQAVTNLVFQSLVLPPYRFPAQTAIAVAQQNGEKARRDSFFFTS